MLTHNFLDKLEMTTRAVISSLSRIAAAYHNDLTYIKSILKNNFMNIENKKVKNTVILVDDSSIDNFVNTKIITRYQFADEVILFTKSKKALAFMLALNKAPENDIPGFLFLDLEMPEIDGFEFLDTFNLLCDKIKKNMKIVILTSSSDPADIEKCNKYDSVIALFHKPLIKDNLETLEKLVLAAKSTLIF